MNSKLWILVAGLLGATGVTLGAYHAHGLEKALAARGLEGDEIDQQMHNCEVAVRHQMYHALALLGIGLLATQRGGGALNSAGSLFVMGVLLFSGGLYAMVFAGHMLHWAIVPSGGLLLIMGWLSLMIAAIRPGKAAGKD